MSDGLGVPVFNCVIYIAAGESGGVRARVANLDGISCQARNEREALSQLLTAFKQQVSSHVQQGTDIPWIEPPHPPEPNEQTRLVPMHL